MQGRKEFPRPPAPGLQPQPGSAACEPHKDENAIDSRSRESGSGGTVSPAGPLISPTKEQDSSGSSVPSSSTQVAGDGRGQDPDAEKMNLGLDPSPSQSHSATDFGSGSHHG